ncbi:MAG TPA: 30S ribosomal protein S6 [Candidatus Paceibacterota bacterium]
MSDTEIEVKESSIEEGDARVYELGYLLVPTIAPEDLSIHYGDLKEAVSSFGGEAIADEMPKMIPLAYPMTKVISNVRNKFTNAYFGWMKFFMDPEDVIELKKKLDLDPNLIRFLMIKTVKENTIASKRFIGREMPHRRIAPMYKPEEKGEAAPINKEEIDKEIDAMIAV